MCIVRLRLAWSGILGCIALGFGLLEEFSLDKAIS